MRGTFVPRREKIKWWRHTCVEHLTSVQQIQQSLESRTYCLRTRIPSSWMAITPRKQHGYSYQHTFLQYPIYPINLGLYTLWTKDFAVCFAFFCCPPVSSSSLGTFRSFCPAGCGFSSERICLTTSCRSQLTFIVPKKTYPNGMVIIIIIIITI